MTETRVPGFRSSSDHRGFSEFETIFGSGILYLLYCRRTVNRDQGPSITRSSRYCVDVSTSRATIPETAEAGTEDNPFGFACGSFSGYPTRYLGYKADENLAWSATSKNKWEYFPLEEYNSEKKYKLKMWKDNHKAPVKVIDPTVIYPTLGTRASSDDYFQFYKW
ncbi:hypothetical protein C8J56DRAFT_1086523 [Mycena floridula]|nr:hypothetical protein C8J56DRAFT_1086523 [Mycena floridula]